MSSGDRIDRELELALRFRAEGRHGRARVCARRAAGWAIGPTYTRSTGAEAPASALALLRWFRDNPQTPHRLRRAAVRLTAHVNKDHDLPFAEDPCEDARLIVDAFRR